MPMTCCAYCCTQKGLDFFHLLRFSSDSHSCSSSNVVRWFGTFRMAPELQNIGSNTQQRCSMYWTVTYWLSYRKQLLPYRQSNLHLHAVSVDSIKAYEEVDRHAFLISAIHGDKWSCLKPDRFISEGTVALPNKWEDGWAPGPEGCLTIQQMGGP